MFDSLMRTTLTLLALALPTQALAAACLDEVNAFIARAQAGQAVFAAQVAFRAADGSQPLPGLVAQPDTPEARAVLVQAFATPALLATAHNCRTVQLADRFARSLRFVQLAPGESGLAIQAVDDWSLNQALPATRAFDDPHPEWAAQARGELFEAIAWQNTDYPGLLFDAAVASYREGAFADNANAAWAAALLSRSGQAQPLPVQTTQGLYRVAAAYDAGRAREYAAYTCEREEGDERPGCRDPQAHDQALRHLADLAPNPEGLPYTDDTLCDLGESIYFSCTLRNGKVASLCARQDLTAGNGYVQYRYGTQRDVEMLFPSRQMAPGQRFTWVSEGDERKATLLFGVGQYQYRLTQAPVPSVIALKGDAEVFRQPCELGQHSAPSFEALRLLKQRQ